MDQKTILIIAGLTQTLNLTINELFSDDENEDEIITVCMKYRQPRNRILLYSEQVVDLYTNRGMFQMIYFILIL